MGARENADALLAAIEEGARRILAWSPPPLCGSRERPHLVAPGGKPGDVRRCVTCGDIGTIQKKGGL